jgi:hypothetical protein
MVKINHSIGIHSVHAVVSVEGNTTDTCNNAEYAGWVG